MYIVTMKNNRPYPIGIVYKRNGVLRYRGAAANKQFTIEFVNFDEYYEFVADMLEVRSWTKIPMLYPTELPKKAR